MINCCHATVKAHYVFTGTHKSCENVDMIIVVSFSPTAVISVHSFNVISIEILVTCTDWCSPGGYHQVHHSVKPSLVLTLYYVIAEKQRERKLVDRHRKMIIQHSSSSPPEPSVRSHLKVTKLPQTAIYQATGMNLHEVCLQGGKDGWRQDRDREDEWEESWPLIFSLSKFLGRVLQQ